MTDEKNYIKGGGGQSLHPSILKPAAAVDRAFKESHCVYSLNHRLVYVDAISLIRQNIRPEWDLNDWLPSCRVC